MLIPGKRQHKLVLVIFGNHLGFHPRLTVPAISDTVESMVEKLTFGFLFDKCSLIY